RTFQRVEVNDLRADCWAESGPLETAHPGRIPPTLAFTEARVNRHREQPESRAYLFALNLLAVYALGWMPEKPLYPLGPWEATAKRARKAQEILVFDLFKGRIDAVAKRVYWLKVRADGKIRWEPRDGGVARLARDEQGVGALMDQGAHLIIFPLAGSVALLMQSHGSGYSGRPIYLTEPAPPVNALRLVLLARHAKVNALESGEA